MIELMVNLLGQLHHVPVDFYDDGTEVLELSCSFSICDRLNTVCAPDVWLIYRPLCRAGPKFWMHQPYAHWGKAKSKESTS